MGFEPGLRMFWADSDMDMWRQLFAWRKPCWLLVLYTNTDNNVKAELKQISHISQM